MCMCVYKCVFVCSIPCTLCLEVFLCVSNYYSAEGMFINTRTCYVCACTFLCMYGSKCVCVYLDYNIVFSFFFFYVCVCVSRRGNGLLVPGDQWSALLLPAAMDKQQNTGLIHTEQEVWVVSSHTNTCNFSSADTGDMHWHTKCMTKSGLKDHISIKLFI